MPRPPGHGPNFERRRKEIIDLSAQLFAKRGFAATGVREICDTVGLAKGALYYYIKSKENLLVEIQSSVLDPLLQISEQVSSMEGDPVVRLRLLSEALLDIILKRLPHIWVYEHDYLQLSGPKREELLRQRRQFENVVARVIEEAIDADQFRDMSPQLATLQFLNMHNHTYQWIRPGGKWDAPLLSREYCATLFVGFGYPRRRLPSLEGKVERFWRQHPPSEFADLGVLSTEPDLHIREHAALNAG